MQVETAILRHLGPADAVAWGRHVRGRVSTVKRVIHLYTVEPVSLQMICVNCGLNIVNTKYGEGAFEAGTRHINQQEEKCCNG